mmetsp:Transcript_11362/g.26218  ORF Transcript_11362/g.26218 Transcript_11362/m.26218 type:complete len:85 (-) Transcript_11362:252-506(-)
MISSLKPIMAAARMQTTPQHWNHRHDLDQLQQHQPTLDPLEPSGGSCSTNLCHTVSESMGIIDGNGFADDAAVGVQGNSSAPAT